ncbi:MAG: lytic transglycosylase domain-containing protein [Ferruginibacter sp.]
MKAKAVIFKLTFWFFFIGIFKCSGHDIFFCDERIPVEDRFVADKLMNIIRKQINYVNMPKLREGVKKYFGIVEYYLRATGLPEDFKYLPIVESGFQNAISNKGAGGYWQIMPPTAKERGLAMTEDMDERNDINKSTYAACKEIARNYLIIKKTYGISSWVLTAAAYNYGIGNISNNIKRQGTNYFQMNLNAETAAYVYKIIAIKELFEFPELYMKNFGYNVFNSESSKLTTQEKVSDVSSFSSMTLKVNEKDGNHPDKLDTTIAMVDKNKILDYKAGKTVRFIRPKFVYAQVVGKYKHFKDGDMISFELQTDLKVGNYYASKGYVIERPGWKIDDRVFIDLGLGNNVILYDLNNTHGISFSSLRKKEPVIIMINTREE